MSVTFDDGLESHVTVGAPLLEARNLRGTFYVLTQDEWNEWPGYWDDWRTLAAAGHEIGSHTLTHAQLSTFSEAEMRKELLESRDIVDAEITTQSCRTIAYPYGDYDDLVEEVTAEYYIAGRTVWSPLSLTFYPGDPCAPMDAFAIGSDAFDYPAITTLEALVERIDSAEEYGAWFIPHVHALTDPLAVSVLSGFLDDLVQRDLWVATLGDVVRYMQERVASTLTVLEEGPAQIVLELTHGLDPAIHDLPLTVRSVVPGGWSLVGVVQGGGYDLVEAAPPGALALQWSMVSGPAPVAFLDAAAATTAATFTAPGVYVLELTASDGELFSTDSLAVTVKEEIVGIQTFELRVAADADDAEESPTGAMYLDSSDLELVFDYWNGAAEQVVGLRFNGVGVPQGATITAASVRFQVDESSTDATALVIRGHDADDAQAFSTASGDLSSRPKTAAQASWAPGAWLTPGLDRETPDLSPVLQEIVDRGGWTSGNSAVLVLTGTGRRVAESYEGSAAGAALLHLEFAPPSRGAPRGR